MRIRKTQIAKAHGRTVGNLALANEIWDWESWQPKVEYKRLRLVEPSQMDGTDGIEFDSLAAFKGIITGISVSMIMWSLILMSFGLNINPVFPLVAVIVLMLVV